MAKNYVNNPEFLKCIIKYKEDCKKAKELNKDKPRIPEYAGECIWLIANRMSTKFNFSGYCVDTQTEALTKSGWKNHTNINLNDEILSYDPTKKQLVWSKILDLYIEKYNGNMFKMLGSTIDALVTPGHKFYTKENGLKKIDDILSQEHIVTMADGVEQDVEFYSDEFVNIVGWFITEGSVTRYNRIRDKKTSHYGTIYQSKKVNSHKCLEIEHCLDVLENKPMCRTLKKGMMSYGIDMQLTEEILDVAPNKVLSVEFILKLTKRQKLMLIETIIKADGHKNQYVQKNKNHIDTFVILCTLAGLTTNTNFSKSKTRFGLCEIYTVTISPKVSTKFEKLNLHGGKKKWGGNTTPNRIPHQNQPTIPYNDIVWCPTTEYGTWVCRRNKKIYITGNSFIDEMREDGIENAITYFDNFDPEKYQNPFGYFSLIIWNAFIRRIGKEEKQQYIKLKNLTNQYLFDGLINQQDGEASFDPKYISLTDDFTNDFVTRYETKLKDKKEINKKKMLEKKKKSLENLVDLDEDV